MHKVRPEVMVPMDLRVKKDKPETRVLPVLVEAMVLKDKKVK